MLKQRVLTALVLLAILLPALFYPSPLPFAIVVLVLMAAGAWEWGRMNGWGQVGALALGGALGTIAVIARQEIVLAIMGGIFVVEALSVMLQVTWFKYTKKRYGEGRRLLKMAPLHHHFEKSGWKETQVVVRFWIITMLLCLMGLSTLKLR